MAVNFKKFFFRLLGAIAALFKKREKVKVRVCKISGYLPNEYCTLTEEREYYKHPKPGEPSPPTTACVVCHADDPPVPPDPEKVKVIVCTVNGRLPNEYCKTIEREFLPANVPVNKCVTCKAPWPAKAKYPLYVFVPELMVADGDIDAFMARMRNAGVWGIRLFLLQSWSSVRLVPWLQATYQGVSVRFHKPSDGVKDCPVTDMDKPNAAYWDRLLTIAALAKKNDLELICSLGDNCSFNTRTQKLSYPFLASIDMASTEFTAYIDPPAAKKIFTYSPDGLYGTTKYTRFRQWTKAAISALQASGVSFKIEIQNEFSRFDWKPTDKHPENWYSMMVAAVVGMGVPASRIVHSGDQSVTLSHGGTFAMHGIAQAGMHDTTCPPSRLMLSSDGAYAGKFKGRNPDDYDAADHHGPSIEDAVAIAKMVRSKGIEGGIELMIMNAWRQNDCLANVDNIKPEIFAAVTAEWAR